MNNRRRLVITLLAGGISVPLASFAQPQRPNVARVGLLESSSSSVDQREALIAGLRELGLVEGKNIIIEYRWADGNYERLPALAAELVRMKVDVILAGGTPAGAALHIARTVCRRAERRIVSLHPPVDAVLVRYVNRLSDLLFVLARAVNHQGRAAETEW